MSGRCCQTRNPGPNANNSTYTKVLWTVLAINAAMFLSEVVVGFAARSVSLQADALDFFGDAANYGISLSVAGLSLNQRARAALLKGISMGGFGLWIVGSAFWLRKRLRWGSSDLQLFLRTR
jgi:Co/Zn/Cd efflux system component